MYDHYYIHLKTASLLKWRPLPAFKVHTKTYGRISNSWCGLSCWLMRTNHTKAGPEVKYPQLSQANPAIPNGRYRKLKVFIQFPQFPLGFSWGRQQTVASIAAHFWKTFGGTASQLFIVWLFYEVSQVHIKGLWRHKEEEDGLFHCY